MGRQSLKNIARLIESVKEELPVEQSFLNDLKRSIEINDERERRKPSQTYKPSSMNCVRGMYYQVTGAEPDEGQSNYTLVGICNSGTDIHARTQDAVMKMTLCGMDCEYVNVADFVRERGLDYLTIVKEPNPDMGDFETKLFHKDLNMSFLCDGIVRYKGHYYILELKTESSFKWLERKGVDPKHYNQGTAYSIALGINDVIFVYITRDILDMKSYMFTPTDDMKQELLGKISNCDSYVARCEVPPIPDNISNRICTYCSYRNRCKQDIN